MRIYEVKTEDENGKQYDTYRMAAESFAEVVTKVTEKHIEPYKHHEGYTERISQVIILASED